jgi:putative nucleotidyltransferase with HDIG domain
MKKIRLILSSFRIKVTLILIFSLVLVMGLSNLLIYKFALDSQLNQIREKLKVIARTATLIVDTDLLLQIPLNREGANSSPFKIITGKLKTIREINPPVKSVYILTKTEKEGIWQFMVDLETKAVREEKPAAKLGDKYDASRFPEMMKAFKEASADRKPMVDEWGVTLSGYAPVRDSSGKAVAVLGVDISAADLHNTQKEVHRRAVFVLVIGILLSLGLGILMSKRISDPIKKLAEGTRRISLEDLEYNVEIKGSDEISELSRAFNQMALNLSESRRRLDDYFYRVLQSLVRILEAKDTYTRGHSDRVADYAAKIAFEMGFSKENVELLKKAAQLHDIGKLAIHQNILNKKGKLTEEEWAIIQEHPVIGEEILKPVLLDKEMLEVVRSHHERYDGKGYPDKISGENISIFAQIISVADAYDAMTSLRAYRPALDKEEAMEELKGNSGSQFNSQVVESFLKILKMR